MLNDNRIKLVEVLDKLCVEGYNTIDKIDILDCLENNYNINSNADILEEEMNFLIDNKIIIVKYSDDMVYCLAFTEEGTELVNRVKVARQNEENSKKSKKQIKSTDSKQLNPVVTSMNIASTKQNALLSSLNQSMTAKNDKSSKIKNFIIGLLGGVLGGGISGAIIVLCVLFI